MRKLLSLALAIVMLLSVASNLFACSFEMRDPMNPTANPNRGEQVTANNQYVENVRPQPEDSEKEPYKPETAEPEKPDDPIPPETEEPKLTYTVTFVVEGNTDQPQPQEVMPGECVQVPEFILDENYHLDGGWYTDPSFQEVYRYRFDIPVSRDLTLYARVKNAYSVTFVVEGNTDQPEMQLVSPGKTAQYPDFIVDMYCIFNGVWYTDPSYQEVYRYRFDVPVTRDLTLYARVEWDPLHPAWIADAGDMYDIITGKVSGNYMVNMMDSEGMYSEGTYEFVRLISQGGDPYVMVGQNLGTMPNYLVVS